jgi:glycosyltransferase involved in cell wall biosynthesis
MKPKLMYAIGADRFDSAQFLERAAAAQDAGYDVAVMASAQPHGADIRAAGLRLVPVNFSRRPVAGAFALLKAGMICRRERPHVLHYLGPFLPAGMFPSQILPGNMSPARPFMMRLLQPCLRLACRLLHNRSRIVFENQDDAAWFAGCGLARPAGAAVIRGAGIDLKKFRPADAAAGGPPVVALVAPMRRDSGVHEFVTAARMLHDAGVSARFVLVGAPGGGDDPASIPFAQLRSWHGEGGIEWWEWLTDMRLMWRDVHVACLPSLHGSRQEGVPAPLIEAAACGLPIVATDAAGSRHVVKNGDNGLLVPAGNVPELAAALRILIADADLRCRMGRQSRARAEREFSSTTVIGDTLAVYQSLLPAGMGSP